MSLKATTRTTEGVTIIDLSGRVTLGEAAGTLRDAVRTALDSGQKKILLNLGDVSYVDSAGLGEMVGTFTTAANAGGQLKLLNVQKKLKDLLQITKLYTVFPAFDNEQEAIKSFSAAA